MINYLKKRNMVSIAKQLRDDVPSGRNCEYNFNRGYEQLRFYVDEFIRVTVSHNVKSKIVGIYVDDTSDLGVAVLLSKQVICGRDYDELFKLCAL